VSPVFGCYVVTCSEYTPYADRAQAARDYLICMFWRDETKVTGVRKSDWLKVAKIPLHIADEIIKEIAVRTFIISVSILFQMTCA